jgi:hypothetical protein
VTDPAARLLRLLRRRVLGARRKATTEALAPWVRVVSEGMLCGVKPGKRHWADCYRRACDYVLAHTAERGSCPPIIGMRLVHGVCGDTSDLWAHAWVELPGGVVFDGVRQQFYDRDGYRTVLHAMVEATYDAPEMIEQMRESERYGPWHAGVLGRDATRRLVGPVSAGGVLPAPQPALA